VFFTPNSKGIAGKYLDQRFLDDPQRPVGGVWLIFTRPSAVSAIAAETQLLDWSSAEMKMVDWVCLDLILPLLV
jgi:hypothetical protein